MDENNGNQLSFEEAISQLEAIVKQLEQGEASLEDLLDKFSEGITLSRICLGKLNAAEKQIDTIIKYEAGAIIEQPLRLQEE